MCAVVAVLLAAPANSSGQPSIISINPTSTTAGGPPFTLNVNGTGFDSAAVVDWNGAPLSTLVESATLLKATVTADLIATAGMATVTVSDNGATSSGVTFNIVPPAPVISSLNPSSTVAGGNGFTLTVNGSNFDSSASVQWNGTGLSTSYMSAGQLTATVTADLIASAGAATVTVADNGQTSNVATFTIIAPPTITSISPSATSAGGPVFTLTVVGTGFDSMGTVLWNGSPLPTNFVTNTQLTATVAPILIASPGTALVSVSDNGATSNSATFTIAPVPAITFLSPNPATAGQAGFTLTVNGSGFVSGAVVQWNSTALTTTFVSAAQLTAPVAASAVANPGSATVTVTEDGVTSNGATFTIAALTITSLSPNTATAGQPGFTLTVNGTGFVSGAVVQWNSTALTTTFVSATQLTAPVAASLVAAAGSATITVTENGVTSANATFTINTGPAITSLIPSSATVGQASFTLTVNGTGFVSGAVVQWNSTALTTTFVSATQLTAPVAAGLVATAGSVTITVTENGVSSAGAAFTINAGPAITSLSPSSTTAGQGGFTLTVNGTGFVSGAVVQWNSTALATTFVSATQLTAPVAASLVATAGSVAITVIENGVTSAGATFTINAGPAITSLSPNTASAGGAAFALTVNGTGFVSTAVVQWNGTALSTTFVSATQLTATVAASLISTPGSASVTVAENGVTSAAATFTIVTGPVINSLSPPAATAGGPAFVLTVNGTGFLSGAIVQWNSTALTTTFVNSNQLTAQVPANLIASPGTVTVTVVENGVTSAGATFTIAAGPVITSLSPNTATAGAAAFTLTVNGTGFVSSAIVQWNGTALTTSFASASQLTAQVPASLIAAVGTANVTVVENGVTSAGATFTIAAMQVITSLSPNVATAGGPAFTLTVNGTGFASGAVVQWNSTALATTFVSATQLTATVAASLVATTGSATITVTENGVTSAGATFTIAAGQVITSLSPSSATAGGPALTLTVNGTGFASGAVVEWNSTALITTYVSTTQLTAAVPASLIITPGSASITAMMAGTTSPAEPFTIVPALSLSAPSTTSPTQNAVVSVTLNPAVTTQLTGTLEISFEADSGDANTPSGYQDPNMVFVSTSTTTMPFTIPNGATTATLGNLQQGTVAGTITVTMTSLLAGTADVLPQPAPTFTIQVPLLAPVIEAGSVKIENLTSTGFDVELNAFSTSRDLQETTFVFTGASGSTLNGQTSFQVSYSSAAASYFAGSTGLMNGGNFGLTVHFNYSGDTSVIGGGSVAVTLSNAVGASSAVTGESQ